MPRLQRLRKHVIDLESFARNHEEEGWDADYLGGLGRLSAHLSWLSSEKIESDRKIMELEARISERDEVIADRDETIRKQTDEIKSLNEKVENLTDSAQIKSDEITILTTEREELRNEIRSSGDRESALRFLCDASVSATVQMIEEFTDVAIFDIYLMEPDRVKNLDKEGKIKLQGISQEEKLTEIMVIIHQMQIEAGQMVKHVRKVERGISALCNISNRALEICPMPDEITRWNKPMTEANFTPLGDEEWGEDEDGEPWTLSLEDLEANPDMVEEGESPSSMRVEWDGKDVNMPPSFG